MGEQDSSGMRAQRVFDQLIKKNPDCISVALLRQLIANVTTLARMTLSDSDVDQKRRALLAEQEAAINETLSLLENCADGNEWSALEGDLQSDVEHQFSLN